MANNNLKSFRMWCQKVLPLVYDDSLSYYEVLCKVVTYLNNVIEGTNGVIDDVEGLRNDLATVQNWINNFDTKYAEKIIAQYIATMVFFGLTDSGYFVAYIPENWESINFGTTGLDVDAPIQPEFGHLVLLY